MDDRRPGQPGVDEIELCAPPLTAREPSLARASLLAIPALTSPLASLLTSPLASLLWLCLHSDPPLGSVPDFTFSHPVLRGMNERWRRGGGSTRLMAILK